MEFKEVVALRHSVRQFSDRPVEREKIDSIIDIALTAPSSKNTKSSAFMVVEDEDTISALSQMRTSGSTFVKDAKAVIVVMGDMEKTDLWKENCSISTTFIQLAAVDEGLGTTWVHVNGRPRSKDGSVPGNAEDYVRELLGIKENMGILCVVAMGYPE